MTEQRPKLVREQVVVYLGTGDRALLEELAAKSGLSRTELFRRGLRRLAEEALERPRPGFSLERLAASAAEDDFPPDVAERHDSYLYGGEYQQRLTEKRAGPD